VESAIVVADTSVLVNFLRIDRMDLIGHHPQRFLATDHVDAEITDHYPEQRARYQRALASNMLDTCSVVDPEEVELFLRLRAGGRLGAGECSALAVAVHRRYPIAIDDNRAVKRAARELGAKLEILRTVDVMVGLIGAGVLDVLAADEIKLLWAQHHRFRIKAKSFGELL
jgi:predicted nucleic acid-binding protein